MRRRIHLHGALKAIHPKPIEIDAGTVAEAIEAVTRQLPGFAPNAVAGRREIQVAWFNDGAEPSRSDRRGADLHLFPPMSFSENGGILETITGAALAPPSERWAPSSSSR